MGVSDAPVRELRLITFIGLLCCIFVSVTNASMGALVLPDLRRDFNLPDDELSLFVVAYLIPFAIGTVVYGRLSDIYGTRRLFLFGMALFAAGSFAVALAPNYWLVVAARFVQGMGGTAIPAISTITTVRSYTGEHQARAIGATVGAVGIGFGSGPLLGGVLTDAFGWQGPLVATGSAAAAMLVFLLFLLPDIPGTTRQRFDYAGAALLALALSGIIVALNRLPNTPADPAGLTGAIAAAPLIVAFGFRIRHAAAPFVAPALLRSRGFMTICAIGFCAQGAHFVTVVLLPLLMERYHDMSVLEIGLRLLPGACTIAVTGVFAGRLASRLGHRTMLIIGGWLVFNAAATFVIAGAGWSPRALAGIYVLLGAGYGLINSNTIPAAMKELPEEHTGTGIGVYNVVFFLGGAVAVAIEGAILRLREGATQAWTPIFEGIAPEFSDAGLVLLALTAAGFLLALIMRGSPEQEPVAPAWTGRLKPNKRASL